MKKIGLLGGSFDPIHIAHVNLAITALKFLFLDEVQLIPAGNPWQKGKLHASSSERIDMISLAIKDYENIKINNIEIERNDNNSYTIDTINAISDTNKYILILGSDQINNFHSWHNWKEIIKKVDLAIAKRDNNPFLLIKRIIKRIKKTNKHIHVLPLKKIHVSSSYIRECIKKSIPVNRFLNPDVLEYIKQKNIY
ncbi:nicotinate (nicotinamide) nucleotide adenylyltransferase [Candidatus Kinetoplastidibacterium desouzai]|uniref:nicotinate (nicotinamide) nucleotide adenylyltransferase n=1 Tax=Candidatus Kinetoplastidibacterium desouzai TaxID=994692 RepID=UPI0004BB57CA|nr:nicotinate (nicotinamide) nucleotide adenylyltransferase [Candidatus Kinetoplastibacterium desouzaii]